MSDLKDIIKEKAFKSSRGILLYSRLRSLVEKIALKFISDRNYITSTYKKRFGHEINLQDPQKYTEKLQWLKLNYRDDIMPICTDKYEVHRYLSDLGHANILNQILGVYKSADDINFDSLPNKFVAKATHGSSSNLVCHDKSKLEWNSWRKIMNSWLELNLYSFGREWNYKDIQPRIIIEQLIDYVPLIDYKFMCFNGIPRFLQINNSKGGVQYVDFYDIDWNRVDFTYNKFKQSDHVLPKPPQFEEMKDLAQELSAPFPFVRVDLYNPPGKIIFGELTFFPGSGLLPLIPVKNNYDELLGSFLDLTSLNRNDKL